MYAMNSVTQPQGQPIQTSPPHSFSGGASTSLETHPLSAATSRLPSPKKTAPVSYVPPRTHDTASLMEAAARLIAQLKDSAPPPLPTPVAQADTVVATSAQTVQQTDAVANVAQSAQEQESVPESVLEPQSVEQSQMNLEAAGDPLAQRDTNLSPISEDEGRRDREGTIDPEEEEAGFSFSIDKKGNQGNLNADYGDESELEDGEVSDSDKVPNSSAVGNGMNVEEGEVNEDEGELSEAVGKAKQDDIKLSQVGLETEDISSDEDSDEDNGDKDAGNDDAASDFDFSSSDSDSDLDLPTTKLSAKEREKLLIEADDIDAEVIVGELRTKNEIAVLPKVEPVDITIPEDAPMHMIGEVSSIVNDQVIVQAHVSGDYQVLDIESILVFEDRSIVGRIFDTFGPVTQPMYSIRFNSPDEITPERFYKGRKVYYVPDHVKMVFTQPLKAQKGSDASNIHDEEIGEEEMEFSDDEAEIEHKRLLKMKRKGGRNAMLEDGEYVKDEKPSDNNGRVKWEARAQSAGGEDVKPEPGVPGPSRNFGRGGARSFNNREHRPYGGRTDGPPGGLRYERNGSNGGGDQERGQERFHPYNGGPRGGGPPRGGGGRGGRGGRGGYGTRGD
ncbi:hypothetical protein HK104_009768, partial [Borealophlyctis nickersoniae]